MDRRGITMAETFGIMIAEEVEREDREQEIIDREQEAMEVLQEGEEYSFKFQKQESEEDGFTYTVTIVDNELGKAIFSTDVDYIKTDQMWNEIEECEEFVIRIPLPDDYFDDKVSDQE